MGRGVGGKRNSREDNAEKVMRARVLRARTAAVGDRPIGFSVRARKSTKTITAAKKQTKQR